MTKRKYRNYTDEDIVENAKNVKSIAGLLRSLDLRLVGGNYATMKKHIERLNIDITHWTGSLWSKGEKLKDWSEYTRGVKLKPHLIKERGHKCEECSNIQWNNVDIPLELHHIDGDRTNNEKENLQLLCPNCHALTHNWRGRKS